MMKSLVSMTIGSAVSGAAKSRSEGDREARKYEMKTAVPAVSTRQSMILPQPTLLPNSRTTS